MIEAMCGPARTSGSQEIVGFRAPDPSLPRANRPLVGLADSDLAGRFRHWIGASGRRYLFSVFAVTPDGSGERCPRYQEAVVLAVRRAPDGTRRLLWAGQTGHLPDLLFDGDAMKEAIGAGANEIHMHLLAKDRTARDIIVRDIAG